MKKSILGVIFDLKFDEFVTTRVIKFLFFVWVLASAIWSLVILGYGLASKDVEVKFGALLVASFTFLLLVVMGRIWLELIIVVFRIAENTAKLVQFGVNQPQKLQDEDLFGRRPSIVPRSGLAPIVPSGGIKSLLKRQGQLSPEEAKDIIRAACLTSLGIKVNQIESSFGDLRIPPGNICDLLDDLEARYGIVIPPTDRSGIRCAADIERYVLRS